MEFICWGKELVRYVESLCCIIDGYDGCLIFLYYEVIFKCKEFFYLV